MNFKDYRKGRKVRGPGTETSDSIPALLSKNEFVIKAKSAKKLGYDALNHMNRTGELPMRMKMSNRKQSSDMAPAASPSMRGGGAMKGYRGGGMMCPPQPPGKGRLKMKGYQGGGEAGKGYEDHEERRKATEGIDLQTGKPKAPPKVPPASVDTQPRTVRDTLLPRPDKIDLNPPAVRREGWPAIRHELTKPIGSKAGGRIRMKGYQLGGGIMANRQKQLEEQEEQMGGAPKTGIYSPPTKPSVPVNPQPQTAAAPAKSAPQPPWYKRILPGMFATGGGVMRCASCGGRMVGGKCASCGGSKAAGLRGGMSKKPGGGKMGARA